MAVGLRWKDQLPTERKVRDEFENLVSSLNAELEDIRNQLATVTAGTTVAATNPIVSVQELEVTIAIGALTGSASFTIPIDSRYTQVIFLGRRSLDAGGAHGYAHAYVSAITDTQLTITRDATGGGGSIAVTCRYMLVQWRASFLRSQVQIGTIDLSAVTTNTATIQGVGPKYVLGTTGCSTTTVTQESDTSMTVKYTNSVTLTGDRATNNGTAHVGYCIVDFN